MIPSRRQPARRRTVHGLAALAVAAGALTGCASAVDQQNSAGSGSCVDGGTLNVAHSQAPIPGNVLTGGAANVYWVRAVFEPLVLGGDEDPSQVEPLLASDVTFGDDDLSAVITLRDDVTFHSGRAMSADDVIYTVEQATADTSPSNVKSILRTWEIEKTGDLEVTITSERPLSPVLASTLEFTPIVDSETFADAADGSQLIGTGPYRVDDYQAGASISLTRNDDYWGEDEPRPDEIVVESIGDSTAQISALRSGSADIAYGLTPQDATQFVDSDDSFGLVESTQVVYPLQLDTDRGPTADPAVREAISMAIDRDRIKEQVFSGIGTTTGLYWSEDDPAFPEDLSDQWSYDPDAARAMIEDAGATGERVDISYINLPAASGIYQIVANNLEAIGLEVTATPLAGPDFQARGAEGALGTFLGLRAVNGGPAFQLLTSQDLRLQGAQRQFTSPEYTELVDDVIDAGAENEQAVEQLTQYLLDTRFMVVLLTASQPSVVSTRVQGLEYTLGGMIATDLCLTR